MDNTETLSIQGTQDEEKQNKNTPQHVLDTTICKQIIGETFKTVCKYFPESRITS